MAVTFGKYKPGYTKHRKAVGKNECSSWAVKLGKPLRQFINPIIRKYSKVGNTPILDIADFPWADELSQKWEIIRDEANDILNHYDAIPSISTISPDHKRLDAQKKWRSFFMWGYGFRSDFNCSRAPQTAALVEKVPGLSTALFSIHEPGMSIQPHKGVTAGICVFHLGLSIPESGKCAIRVENKIYEWKEGQGFIFDDTFEHETWNNTAERRIILLLHVKRPVSFPGNILADFFMGCIRRTSFITDALNGMKEWELAYAKLEKKTLDKKTINHPTKSIRKQQWSSNIAPEKPLVTPVHVSQQIFSEVSHD